MNIMNIFDNKEKNQPHNRRATDPKPVLRETVSYDMVNPIISTYGLCTGSKIIEMEEAGLIDITGFDPNKVNPNSYNLSLGDDLIIYKAPNDKSLLHRIEKVFNPRKYAIDCKKDNESEHITIPKEGYLLKPGVLYLGKTKEFTTCSPAANVVPMLDGRSSIGRLGIFVHITAGFGDVGFCGNWTLEIMVVHPTIIYPGMDICQISYYTIAGDPNIVYHGKYQNDKEIGTSKLHIEL